MKKELIILTILLYLTVFCFLMMTYIAYTVFDSYYNVDDFDLNTLYIRIFTGLGIFLTFICFIYILYILLSKKIRKRIYEKNYFKFIMVIKLILIPFYIINFILLSIYLIGFAFSFGLQIIGFFIGLIGIIFTYLTLIATSYYNFITIHKKYCDKQIKLSKTIILILSQFIYLLDVIFSIIIVTDKKINNSNGNQKKEDENEII